VFISACGRAGMTPLVTSLLGIPKAMYASPIIWQLG